MSQIGLLELFSLYGTVKAVTIITDQESGESKGYGFVTMEDEPGATRATANLNGRAIGERILTVRPATVKKIDEGSPKTGNDHIPTNQVKYLSKNNIREKPKRPRRQR